MSEPEGISAETSITPLSQTYGADSVNRRILDGVSSPADIKGLSYAQLNELAAELRGEIIAVCASNGGHLASSLGAVEIVLAAHRMLDCPHDKLVFDVGHQAYAHKLLTGRLDRFQTLRQSGGISGFPKITESPYDAHDSGHASDSLSTALGYALARDLRGGDETIVAVIGDASISGGLALEALNTIGQGKTKVIVILNDNEMSISRNVGALSLYLGRLRTSNLYTAARDQVERSLSSTGALGRVLVDAGEAAKRSVKHLVVPGMLFEEFGFTYIGPINGHGIADIEDAIASAKQVNGPVLIHAVTRKGAGYPPAEERPELFHGVGPFDIATGRTTASPSSAPSYTKVFSDALIAEAIASPDVVAISAAMLSGTGLDAFARRFPSRCIDVGIAEANAVVIASGMALAGLMPVVAIYSTFLQRAYDEIVINVALQGLHVVFAVDRAGVVGADGPTHHGLFDIAFLRSIPNMRILAPSDEAELSDALHTAIALDGPVAVRYPRGTGEGVPIPRKRTRWETGVSIVRREPAAPAHEGAADGDDALAAPCRPSTDPVDVEMLALGHLVPMALKAADLLARQGLRVRVTDMRWVKPLDEVAVGRAAAASLVVTVEEGVIAGGFGSAVLESLSARGSVPRTLLLGLPDRFVGQGKPADLLAGAGLSPEGIALRVSQALDDLTN